jgi:hypothetical protein
MPLWQGHYAMEEQLQDALGETRYGEYRRSQDYTFRGLIELTDQYDVPIEAAAQVHSLREAVLQQIRDLRQSANLTSEQRLASLHHLRTETEKSVRKALGDAAYDRYTQIEIGGWMETIGQP